MVSGDPNTIGSFGELPDDCYKECRDCDNFYMNKRFIRKPSKNAYGLCSKHHQIVKVRDGCSDNE